VLNIQGIDKMNSIISRVAASSTLSQQLCRAFASETAISRTDLVEKAKEVSAPDFAPELPSIQIAAQGFQGDLRSTSALSLGDGIKNHTTKWLQKELGGTQTTPIEYIMAPEPIKVHGLVVASYGVDDPALGCPVEYISLKGTSKEHPAVCKYTGNKYYSDWKEGGHH
jgi:NADH dehydrogenase (ubiquinone) Fe-S protein 6